MDRRPLKGMFARGAALAFVAAVAVACGRGPATSSEYNNSGRDVALALNSGVSSNVDNHSVPWSQLALERQQQANAQGEAGTNAQAPAGAPNATAPAAAKANG